MTTITHGPDGQTRFDGMTVDEFVEAFDAFAFVHGDDQPMVWIANHVLRHLSDRVAELEAMPKLTITHSESSPFDVRELLAEYDALPPGPMEATP